MRGWSALRKQRGLQSLPRQLRARPLCLQCNGPNLRHQRPSVLHATPTSFPGTVRDVTVRTVFGPGASLGLELPPDFDHRTHSSWLDLIEPLLPPELRRQQQNPDPYAAHPATEKPIVAIVKVIAQARMQADLDLLAYIGLNQGRWDAMLWIFQAVIEMSGAPRALWKELKSVSTVDWPSNLSLDEITLDAFLYENQSQHPLAHGDSLRNISSSHPSITAEFSETKYGQNLGQLWQSLGRLLIEAGSRPATESHSIMSNVLRVLAHLRRYRLIPDASNSFTSHNDSLLLQKMDLATRMFKSLPEVEDEARLVTASQYPDTNIGPQIWLEFLLWWCVQGQWPMQGASIVARMRKMDGEKTWSLFSWRDINRISNVGRRKIFSNGQLESKSLSAVFGAQPPFAPRTISAEVVVALIEGLLATRTTPGSTTYHGMRSILDQISGLKKVLSRDKMSLGTSSWDAVVARFTESSSLFSSERNPVLIENALELTETYGNEINSRNGPKTTASLGSDSTTSYVFDGSDAVIGLFHRILLAYIRSRNVNGALRVLGRLQSLTDINKERSLRDFFDKLRSTPPTARLDSVEGFEVWDDAFDNGFSFATSRIPACLPDIPVATLAELLDLMIETKNMEIATWMVYSEEIDGPWIPESLYGDQLLAPSLIRLAAETNDKALLSDLTRAHTDYISCKTLLALCINHIRCGDFMAAGDGLSSMRETSGLKWSTSQLTSLLQELLLQIYGPGAKNNLDDAASKDATVFLESLLRGDFGLWDASDPHVDNVIGILASLDTHLGDLCSTFVERRKRHRIVIPIVSFNHLMQAAVKIWGSNKGRELYTDCFFERTERDVVGLSESQAPENARPENQVSRQFSMPEGDELPNAQESPEAPRQGISLLGRVDASIGTIRIIIHRALEEARDSDSREISPEFSAPLAPQTEVLRWAANVLKDCFMLSSEEIDYELQGILKPPTRPEPSEERSYGPQTLQIWLALSKARKEWAESSERDLRAFAENRSERQIILESVPPPERQLIHCLSADYGLICQSFGEHSEKRVIVSKDRRDPRVPPKSISETLRGLLRQK